MGGYRTLKRALGETNIERKCRILFGVCLALLVFASFLGVERICQGLVEEVTHQAGTDAVDMALVYLHWHWWQSEPEKVANRDDHDDLLASFSGDLKINRFDSAV